MTTTRRLSAALLNAALLPAFALAFMLAGITHDAPQGGWVGTDTALAQKAHNVPEWTPAIAKAFPACEAFQEGVLAPQVVIVDQQGAAHRVSLEAAQVRATDASTVNDMWVVGLCRTIDA